MNVVKLTGVALVIIAGAAGAVPWYSGMQTEREMREAVATSAADKQAPYTTALVHYERGWLKSRATTRLTLRADPRFQIDVKHEISTMPSTSALVHVHSVPQWPSEAKPMIDYFFGGQPALTVDTFYNYDGSRISRFASPTFTKAVPQHPEATVTWGGLQGTLTRQGETKYVAQATAPSITVEGGTEGQFVISGLRVDSNWDTQGAQVDWQGDAKFAVAEMRFETPTQQVTAKDFGGAFFKHSKGSDLQIGYALRLGSGSSAKAGTPGQSFSNAVLEIQVDKLAKAAVARYLTDFGNAEKIDMDADARTRLTTQLVTKLAMELLRGSPEVHLKKLGVETPGGSMLAHADVVFDGKDLPENFSPMDLIPRITAKADVKLSGTLLRTQMQSQVRPQVEVALRAQGGASTDDNVRAASEQMAEMQIKQATEAGLLRAAGPDFVMEGQYAKGELTINGRPANQLFGGLFGGTPMLNAPQPGVDAMAPAPAPMPAPVDSRAAVPHAAMAIAPQVRGR